jgi:hypothetical protein
MEAHAGALTLKLQVTQRCSISHCRRCMQLASNKALLEGESVQRALRDRAGHVQPSGTRFVLCGYTQRRLPTLMLTKVSRGTSKFSASCAAAAGAAVAGTGFAAAAAAPAGSAAGAAAEPGASVAVAAASGAGFAVAASAPGAPSAASAISVSAAGAASPAGAASAALPAPASRARQHAVRRT